MSAGLSKGLLNRMMNVHQHGIVIGFVFYDPSSATLTATYDGGVARMASAIFGKPWDEVRLQGSTKLFTASKDTYVYIDGTTQVLTYAERANGAAKPTQLDIGANSLWIAKVVTDGTRIVAGGVTDLRGDKFASGLLRVHSVEMSFTATELGATANFPMECNGTILAITGVVSDALAGTDVGTVTAALGLNDVFTAVTTGVLTAAISAAEGTRYQTIPTALFRFARGQRLRLTSAKATAGGRINVEVLVEEAA